MITRDEYMNDSDKLHHEYYAQFVTEEIKQAVLLRWTKEQLQEYYAQDVHFNKVTRIQKWDQLIQPFERDLRIKFKEYGDFWSMAGGVCIGKTAARIIIGVNK